MNNSYCFILVIHIIIFTMIVESVVCNKLEWWSVICTLDIAVFLFTTKNKRFLSFWPASREVYNETRQKPGTDTECYHVILRNKSYLHVSGGFYKVSVTFPYRFPLMQSQNTLVLNWGQDPDWGQDRGWGQG